VAKALLEDLASRGLDSKRRRLFVIDGSLAPRSAIDLIFGVETPVQRCRNHKLRNVLGHLPEAQHDQAQATLKAAFKLDAQDGMAQLQKYATWLERDWLSAANSLREGLDEMFTINCLGLPSELRRCLGTTNLIDTSSRIGLRRATMPAIRGEYVRRSWCFSFSAEDATTSRPGSQLPGG
jgi:transposase-like protein